MTDVVFRCAAILAFTLLLAAGARAQDDRSGLDQLRIDRMERGAPAPARNHERRDSGPYERRDSGQHQPGRFDFYVLALSWSPSFCESSRERNQGRSPLQQCDGRPYSFVVHGLWPQYERGFPRECQVPAPRLSRAIVDTMLDLMPSPRLVFNQWDRHGTCSGLDGRHYFETVRKAREAVQVPARFHDIGKYLMVSPDEVEDAFVEANPGLSRQAISVTCDTRRLSEVRICMTKELRFRDCPELERRACRNGRIAMPPVRGE
jgi:ribonuclease T2